MCLHRREKQSNCIWEMVRFAPRTTNSLETQSVWIVCTARKGLVKITFLYLTFYYSSSFWLRFLPSQWWLISNDNDTRARQRQAANVLVHGARIADWWMCVSFAIANAKYKINNKVRFVNSHDCFYFTVPARNGGMGSGRRSDFPDCLIFMRE